MKRFIAAVLLYGFLLGALWLMCRNAPFDPNDPNTRDDEK
jgi:hypothetical protein